MPMEKEVLNSAADPMGAAIYDYYVNGDADTQLLCIGDQPTVKFQIVCKHPIVVVGLTCLDVVARMDNDHVCTEPCGMAHAVYDVEKALLGLRFVRVGGGEGSMGLQERDAPLLCVAADLLVKRLVVRVGVIFLEVCVKIDAAKSCLCKNVDGLTDSELVMEFHEVAG